MYAARGVQPHERFCEAKKARSGALSGILEQGGGTQCCKERHSAAFLMEDGTVFQAYYFNEDKILK